MEVTIPKVPDRWLDKYRHYRQSAHTSTSTSQSPEEIRMARLGHCHEVSIAEDNFQGQNLVRRQAKQAGHRRVTTAQHVAACNADRLR